MPNEPFKKNMIKLFLFISLLSSVVLVTFVVSSSENFQEPGSQANATSRNDSSALGLSQNNGSTINNGKQDRMSIASFSKLESNSKGRIRCGRPIETNTHNSRITDGKPASIAEFPWLVSLQREKSFWFGFKAFSHSCGASLITPSWLISAAHCVRDREGNLRAVAGVDNLNFMYRAQIRMVDKIIAHPNFDIETYDNDISLLKVNRPFNLETTFSHVAPICFERNVPVETYDIASICGFGAKAFHQRSRTHLYKTEIAIIDPKTCNQSFDNAITDNMICAGGMIQRKRDACSGDSGGPLLLENGDHLSLVGLVSFGNDCATKGYPGIYTKLNNYYDWVLENIDEKLFDP